MPLVSAYRDLSPISRRLCHVSWIYKAIERFIGTFVGISFYLDTGSLAVAISYAVAQIVSINIGYSWGAFAYARFGWGSKRVFVASFVFGLLAFAAFLGIGDPTLRSILFGTFYGICHGSYYLAYHWTMLRHTHDRDRDAYMTVYTTGTLSLDTLVPLGTAFALLVGAWLGINDPFVIAAAVLAVTSAAGILVSAIAFSDDTPLPRPSLGNLRAMLSHPNFPKTAAFFGILRMDAVASLLLLPLLGLEILHSPIDLGFANAIVTFVTIVALILSNRYRTPESRYRFARFGFILEAAASAVGMFSLFAGALSLPAYLLCVLVLPFAKTTSSVITQLYELRAANLLSSDGSNAGMESVIVRDTLIGIGRLAYIAVLLGVYAASPGIRTLIVAGYALWICALLGQAALIRSLDAPAAAVEA